MHDIDAAHCYRWGTFRGTCVYVLVIRVSPAKTDEPIEVQLKGADSCGQGCTLAPHDEYDGRISGAAAMRPADTITVATCKR